MSDAPKVPERAASTGWERPRRVVMLGLDGASWEWLSSPLVREAMPNLRGFLDGSTRGTLMSTVPCYTGPAWTTITTGLDPGRHGIFGFTDRSGRPNSNGDIRASRVWDYIGRVGGRSLVVNVPLTFPPKSTDGVMVAGMPVPAGAPYTSPAGLMPELDSLAGGTYIPDVSLTGTPSVKRTSAALTSMTEARRKALKGLMRREDWDFIGVVFVTPDRIGHSWWKLLVPGSDQYDTRSGEETRREVFGTLQSLDRAIEELLAEQPPHTAVVLCSDHGFGPLNTDVFFDAALSDAGLVSAGGSSSLGSRLARVPHTSLGRMIPRSLVQSVKARVNADVVRSAWTAPVYEQSVYLKDPNDEDVRRRVTEALLALASPTGDRVVTQVLQRDDLFHGDFVDGAPDLFPQMIGEDVQLHDGIHSRTPWVSREALPWGTHAREGVLAMSGPDGGARSSGHARDVTPTLLALLGLSAPGLDGTSLVESPVSEVPDSSEEMVQHELSGIEEAAIFEHLRGLGYVE